jgi:hypothetical protein
MSKTPIALFIYNRPEYTRAALEALSKADRLDECALHIFADGAKSADDREMVMAARAVAKEFSEKLGAKLIERESNLGLAASITGAVTELCEEHGRVIVIEDDLLVSRDFLDYMLQSLDRYKDNKNVLQISGYIFPVDLGAGNDAVLMPISTTWGWATWKRAWESFDSDSATAMEELKDKALRRRFDLDGVYPYFDMLKKTLEGELDSWGIRWWWTVFRAGGLVVYPRRSLVWVGGMDGSGTHCEADEGYNAPGLKADSFAGKMLKGQLSFPNEIKVNEEAFEVLKAYHKGRSGGVGQVLKGIKSGIGRISGRSK